MENIYGMFIWSTHIYSLPVNPTRACSRATCRVAHLVVQLDRRGAGSSCSGSPCSLCELDSLVGAGFRIVGCHSRLRNPPIISGVLFFFSSASTSSSSSPSPSRFRELEITISNQDRETTIFNSIARNHGFKSRAKDHPVPIQELESTPFQLKSRKASHSTQGLETAIPI